jgi:hypothetical protein
MQAQPEAASGKYPVSGYYLLDDSNLPPTLKRLSWRQPPPSRFAPTLFYSAVKGNGRQSLGLPFGSHANVVLAPKLLPSLPHGSKHKPRGVDFRTPHPDDFSLPFHHRPALTICPGDMQTVKHFGHLLWTAAVP